MAKDAMPWESETAGKYKYHPGGDPNAAPKDAPSAVNVVVVPDVTLPKVSPVSKFSRYHHLAESNLVSRHRTSTTSGTNGERRATRGFVYH